MKLYIVEVKLKDGTICYADDGWFNPEIERAYTFKSAKAKVSTIAAGISKGHQKYDDVLSARIVSFELPKLVEETNMTRVDNLEDLDVTNIVNKGSKNVAALSRKAGVILNKEQMKTLQEVAADLE
jgi:hypothetical protein